MLVLQLVLESGYVHHWGAFKFTAARERAARDTWHAACTLLGKAQSSLGRTLTVHQCKEALVTVMQYAEPYQKHV